MHVVLTGASSGIGASLAQELSSRGMKLTLVARREAELRALADRLGTPCHVQPADLSEPDAYLSVIAGAEAAFGPIDLLINNAGIQFVEPGEGVSVARARQLYEVDLLSPIALMQAVLPGMLARKSGAIVNISSVAGLIHTPGMAHYNGAKAALGAFSESMRVELVGRGVHVLTVYPGPVATPMERVARDAMGNGLAVRLMPTGTPDVLARKIADAVASKRKRIVYPGIYSLTRYSRALSQLVTDLFTPIPAAPGQT